MESMSYIIFFNYIKRDSYIICFLSISIINIDDVYHEFVVVFVLSLINAPELINPEAILLIVRIDFSRPDLILMSK